MNWIGHRDVPLNVCSSDIVPYLLTARYQYVHAVYLGGV